MNTHFKYNFVRSLDTNVSSAAYRWALLDDQEGDPNPIMVYIYKNGTAVYSGGRNLLIVKLYATVISMQSQHGVKGMDVLQMVKYLHEDGNDDIVDEAYELGDMTEDERLQKEREKLEATRDDTSRKRATNSSGKDEIVQISINGELGDVARQISHYTRLGYELDGSTLQTTLEAYFTILDKLRDNKFNEDYDTSREDSGENYDILKYVIGYVFGDGTHAGGNSMAKSIIGSILNNFIITSKNKIIAQTGLTSINEEGKEVENKEVNEKLSKNRFDPIKAVENEDSYKEIFCNLALVNAMSGGTLWQYMYTLIKKAIDTRNHFSNIREEDARTYNYVSQFSDKTNGKDGENSRNNQNFLDTIRTERSWAKDVIDMALSYLCSQISEADPLAINPTFLTRSDKIRACNSAKEFLEMIVFDRDKHPVNNLSLTREGLIVRKLNLRPNSDSKTNDVDNSKYLKLKDITRLTTAKACDLPYILEELHEKIENAKSQEAILQDNIAKREIAIADLEQQLLHNIDYGEPVYLNQKVPNFAELRFPLYKLTVQETTEKHARCHRLLMHVLPNGIKLEKPDGALPKEFQYARLDMFLGWYMAEAEPVGTVLTPEARQSIQDKIELEKTIIKNANLKIAKLTGSYSTYYSRNIARDKDGIVETESFILNSWVDPLVEKFKIWNANMTANAQTNPQLAYIKQKADYNMSHNLQKCIDDAQASFASRGNIQEETVNAKNWLVKNVSQYIYTKQELALYAVTNNGEKVVSGGIQIQARVRKEGVYVFALNYVHVIIPMWYGCLNQQNSAILRNYHTGFEGYNHNLLTTFITIASIYNRIKDNPAELDAFEQRTGIFFLRQSDAYEYVQDLLQFHNKQLITKIYPNNNDLRIYELDYYEVFSNLASVAGVALESPEDARKAQNKSYR